MQEYIKKPLGSGRRPSDLSSRNTTILIISNHEMKDIIKIAECLEDSSFVIIGSWWTIKNEVKEQRGEFISMLLSTLGAILLGNMLTGIRIKVMDLNDLQSRVFSSVSISK